MRTFLVTGIIIPPFVGIAGTFGSVTPGVDANHFRKQDWNHPRNYPLIRFNKRRVTLNVCFWNLTHGVLAVRAPNRQLAYEVSNGLWGYLSLAFGFEPDLRGEYVLQ
ncbi:MAG: hypothetical protein ACRELE_00270, partial [Gemmatimonadales bacterium]